MNLNNHNKKKLWTTDYQLWTNLQNYKEIEKHKINVFSLSEEMRIN